MKLKFLKTLGDQVTKGRTYRIYDKDLLNTTYLHFLDNNGNNCTVFKEACFGNYAIIIRDLNKNTKVI